MLTNNHVIIDIETAVDKTAIEKSVGKHLGFTTYDEYLEHEKQFVKPGKQYFPKPIFHKIKVIGMLFIGASMAMKYIDFSHEKDSETYILNDFWNILGRCELPTIVGFNSKRFDIPVISARTGKHMVELSNVWSEIKRFHDVSDNWEKYGPNYFNRFSKYHIDLIEHFGQPYPTLIELCSLYDIPVKTTGHGSKIDDMTNDEIRIYCKEDVISTSKIWSYHMLKNDQEFDINDFHLFNREIKKVDNNEIS